MSTPTAIVTGAGRGIGQHIAIRPGRDDGLHGCFVHASDDLDDLDDPDDVARRVAEHPGSRTVTLRAAGADDPLF